METAPRWPAVHGAATVHGGAMQAAHSTGYGAAAPTMATSHAARAHGVFAAASAVGSSLPASVLRVAGEDLLQDTGQELAVSPMPPAGGTADRDERTGAGTA